jgi:transposase-like protein
MRRRGETGPLNRPDTKARIVRDSLTGKKQADIARELGVARSTVQRFLNREDIAEPREGEAIRLASLIPVALDNVETLVRSICRWQRTARTAN